MSTPHPAESDVSVAEGAADVVPAQAERRSARLALNGLMALGLVGLGGLAAAGALSILGVHLTLPHIALKAPSHPALVATARPTAAAVAAGQPVATAYVTQQVIARPVVAAPPPVAIAPHPEARSAAAAAPPGPRNVPTVATDRHAARTMQGLF